MCENVTSEMVNDGNNVFISVKGGDIYAVDGERNISTKILCVNVDEVTAINLSKGDLDVYIYNTPYKKRCRTHWKL